MMLGLLNLGLATVSALTLAALAAAGVFLALPSHVALAGQPGCTPTKAHAPGDFTETFDAGGFSRQYRLHVPPSYDGSARTPLVVLFHGAGSTDEDIANYTQLPAKADSEGFIVAMPLGTVPDILPLGRIFDHLTFIPNMPDDVAFTDALLDRLESQLCIDTSRVYSTGFSNGGMFSVRLACDLSNRLAAVAPVAGVYYPPFAVQLAGIEPGCPSGPIPLLTIHGTNDQSVFFEGGPVFGSDDLTIRPIETEVLPDWAAHNGCNGSAAGSTVTANVRLVEYQNCAADTVLYVIDNGDHAWPGADDLPDPDVNDEILANDVIWEFFQAHALAVQPSPTPTASPPPAPTVAALPSTGAESPAGQSHAWPFVGVATLALAAAIWYAMNGIQRKEG